MEIRKKLAELRDAFNTHDLDRIMACFADDCVLEMPKGNSHLGHASRAKPISGKVLLPGSREFRMSIMATLNISWIWNLIPVFLDGVSPALIVMEKR
jgi:SnoaL-like domain